MISSRLNVSIKDRQQPHDHKVMKHEVKIMVIDEEQSYQGKGINIGFYFCRSKMSREVIDRV